MNSHGGARWWTNCSLLAFYSSAMMVQLASQFGLDLLGSVSRADIRNDPEASSRRHLERVLLSHCALTKQWASLVGLALACMIYAALWIASTKRARLPHGLSRSAHCTAFGNCYGIAKANRDPLIVVPKEKMKWFVDRKDGATSHESFLMNTIVPEHSFPQAEACRPVYAMRTTIKYITPRLPKSVGTMWTEIGYQFDRHWPTDWSVYTDVALVESLTHIMDAVMCAALLDQSMSRDEAFIRLSYSFDRGVERKIALWPMQPDIFKPLIGPLFLKAPQRWRYSRLSPFFAKAVGERLQALADGGAEASIADYFITWYIMDARLADNPIDPTPDAVAAHFLALKIGAIAGRRMACVPTLYWTY